MSVICVSHAIVCNYQNARNIILHDRYISGYLLDWVRPLGPGVIPIAPSEKTSGTDGITVATTTRDSSLCHGSRAGTPLLHQTRLHPLGPKTDHPRHMSQYHLRGLLRRLGLVGRTFSSFRHSI